MQPIHQLATDMVIASYSIVAAKQTFYIQIFNFGKGHTTSRLYPAWSII